MKKRKIIDLPKPTLELLARCAAVLKPPPALTLSEWADRYRVLSAESSAEPGRWHTDKAPYQREIMDAIGDPHIRMVVIMSAAQIGKTDAFILNPLGYYMDYAPCQPENQFAPGLPLACFGQGMGAIGLPGDASPASRYVRAVFFKENAGFPADRPGQVMVPFSRPGSGRRTRTR